MTKHFFNILSAIVLALAFSACQDDTFSSFEQQEGIKEGETVVSATISFKPLAEGLTSRTAGNATKRHLKWCHQRRAVGAWST